MAEGSGGGALRELLAVFGFGVDTKELDRGKTQLGEFLEHVKKIGEGIAAAFAVEQIYEFAEGQARAMNAIERTGTQLGITTDRVQEFQFAAKSLGMEAEALLNSMGRLQVSQQMATQGNNLQSKAFHDLGVNVKDSNGHFKKADDLMLDVADGIANIKDPTKQAAASVELFGRQGRELLPFLKNGRKGAEEYFKTFKELGGGYTEEALKAGKEFDKQQAKTNLVMTVLKSTIAKALLPIITKLSVGVQHLAKWLNELGHDTALLSIVLGTFVAAATAIAAPFLAAAAPIIAIGAAVMTLYYALEDLYTFLTGGQSETGEILDKIFGEGAQVDILEQVEDAWETIKDMISLTASNIKLAWTELEKFLDASEKAGVILRAALTGKNVGQALLDHEMGKDKGPTDDQKTMIRRIRELKRGRVYNAPGETPEQSELAANVLRYQHPEMSPEFGPLPYIPGVSKPGNTSVSVTVNTPPGLNEKQVGEHVAHHVDKVLKHERRAAAATLPRSGN